MYVREKNVEEKILTGCRMTQLSGGFVAAGEEEAGWGEPSKFASQPSAPLPKPLIALFRSQIDAHRSFLQTDFSE